MWLECCTCLFEWVSFIVCELDLGLSYAFGFSLVFGVLFIAALKLLLSWIFRQIGTLSYALSFVTLFLIS